MNGRPISTDNFRSGRRKFLKQVASLLPIPLVAGSLGCSNSENSYAHIRGSIVGANHKTGHRLRTGNFPPPSRFLSTDILIIGGGISALSAKRWLKQQGAGNVMLLEMDSRVGGNSVSGKNQISAYPWGAHYLPIPDPHNTELLEFLQSAHVITAFDELGLPVYNEYYLCHSPQERLYLNGNWQEGLVPSFGIAESHKNQIERFFLEMEKLKTTKGADGKFAFSIPLELSSSDVSFRKLDSISFRQYLSDCGYNAPPLLWYLEYCCKDDYGANLEQTSAWAGLHYFASRRGNAANASSSAVLTWPEGNAFLMEKLKAQAPENIKTGALVYAIQQSESHIEVSYLDTESQQTIAVRASKIIVCTPQYVTKHLFQNPSPIESPSYAPWLVANITYSELPHTHGAPLCWDNVVYGKESVGYVHANHQDLTSARAGVITYYLPFTAHAPAHARNSIYNRSYNEWKEFIINELTFAHPDIHRYISCIDIWLWGHGMVRPSPGYIWGNNRQLAGQPIDNRIFFAHSDLSGISIFEEAFYQGIKAAKQLLQTA